MSAILGKALGFTDQQSNWVFDIQLKIIPQYIKQAAINFCPSIHAFTNTHIHNSKWPKIKKDLKVYFMNEIVYVLLAL